MQVSDLRVIDGKVVQDRRGSGEGAEPVWHCRPRVRAKPAIADRKVVREEVVGRERLLGVKTHSEFWVHVREAVQEVREEAVHLPLVDLLQNVAVVVVRAELEQRAAQLTN